MSVTDSAEVLARFNAELPLVDVVAWQVSRRLGSGVSVDELRSFGQEGLLRAARAFDPSLGVPFRRYANLRIKGAMFDGLRTWGNLPRRVWRQLKALEAGDRMLATYDEEDAASPATTPEQADSRLSSFLAGMATAIAVGTMTAEPRDQVSPEGLDVTPEDLLAQAELLERVKQIVAGLPDKERTLVERHYFRGEQLDEAAASLGLSKSWGSRLHARAIEAISNALRAGGDL